MPTLLVADRMIDLFGRWPIDDSSHDSVANEFLSLATETDFVSLRVAGCAEDVGVVLECADSSHVVGSKEAGPLRVFRALLTHFAEMAEDESGTPPDPYGDRLRLERATAAGRVRLNVEFANTKEIQYLAIVKATRAAA
ncbi:MAG: hypothetical protein K8U57_26295 [Planctomycetes bacterium]|nr:hypothetical protein [Planctomycetota bacterium]